MVSYVVCSDVVETNVVLLRIVVVGLQHVAGNGKVLVMLKPIILVVDCMIESHVFMLHMLLLLLAQILDGVDMSEVNTFIPYC